MSALGRSALGISTLTLAVIVIFAVAAISLPSPAQAACKCRCVDGEAMTVCSSKRQLRNTRLECNNLACPAVDARGQPSGNGRRCPKRRVLNPATGARSWQRICVQRPKPKPECRDEEFLNPSTGLYDTKRVCPGGP